MRYFFCKKLFILVAKLSYMKNTLSVISNAMYDCYFDYGARINLKHKRCECGTIAVSKCYEHYTE